MDYKNIFIENNLTDINKFFKYMNEEFEYGWMDQNGKKHSGINDPKSYSLQAPEELMNTHYGICWDITELCRCFFENMTSLNFETYYLLYDDNDGCPCHTILVFYDNNKVYWFEPMFNDTPVYYSGIHEYNNITDLFNDFKCHFTKKSVINGLIPANYNSNNIRIYKYDKPPIHINGFQMGDHINNSELITLNNQLL